MPGMPSHGQQYGYPSATGQVGKRKPSGLLSVISCSVLSCSPGFRIHDSNRSPRCLDRRGAGQRRQCGEGYHGSVWNENSCEFISFVDLVIFLWVGCAKRRAHARHYEPLHYCVWYSTSGRARSSANHAPAQSGSLYSRV